MVLNTELLPDTALVPTGLPVPPAPMVTVVDPLGTVNEELRLQVGVPWVVQ
jgi:hypothetical protein